MNGRVAALIVAGGLSLSSNAFAQTGASATTPGNVAPGAVPAGTGVVADPALAVGRPAAAAPEPPRFGRNTEHSLGARFWVWNTPVFLVKLFAHVANDWSGPTTFSPGLEYVYRRGALDVVVGLQYTNLTTGVANPRTDTLNGNYGLVRGRNENDVALERIESQLWTVTANVLFLWGSRINDWFEIQYGMGVGVSAVGGNLYRTQVEPNPAGGYQECRMPGTSAYCDTSNNHYATFDANGQVTGRYAETLTTDSNSGSIPPAVPWLALPHLALHFRPHRHFDVRLDGGYALIGFYGGGAVHYVF